MLPIVQAPIPVLSQPAKKVTNVDKEILTLISEMKETLEDAKDPEGVGLAAPQIGKSLRIFIMKPSATSPITTCINPEIKEVKQLKESRKPLKKKSTRGVKLEGCLSLKDVWGVVKRSPSVQLMYTDELGKSHTKTFRGFIATIIQHEVDHLDGILFPRRVLEQNNKLYKSSVGEKGETIFEELPL